MYEERQMAKGLYWVFGAGYDGKKPDWRELHWDERDYWETKAKELIGALETIQDLKL